MVDRRKSAKKISILHMRRADFRLVRKLLRSPGKILLKVLRSSAGHFLSITS